MRVTLSAATRSFGDVLAVDRAELTAEDGRILALIGPSGCGKSTVLRLIAGFERCEGGTIHLGDRLVSGSWVHVAPELRGVGLVFQADALFPHRRVAGNVAFGLPRSMDAGSRRARVSALLEMVGLAGLGRRFPHELSGGQRQRVALARALAPEPAVVLLDEPFAQLDAQLRATLRGEVRQILSAAGATAILVTHDRAEALTMGDRVAVMIDGRVRQVGVPEQVYRDPADEDVARLLGDADILAGRVAGGRILTEAGPLTAIRPPQEGAVVRVLLRPDDLRLETHSGSDTRIVGRAFLGGEITLVARLPSGLEIRCHAPASSELDIGTPVRLVQREPVVWFTAPVPEDATAASFPTPATGPGTAR